MSANSARLSDQLIRAALSELAAGPDADALLSEVLRVVDATPQAAPKPWGLPGLGRPALIVMTIIVITATLGLVVALGFLRPEPQPTVPVNDFIEPFTYRVPLGETLRLHPRQGVDTILYINHGTRHLEVFLVTGSVHFCGTANSEARASTSIATDPRALLRDLRDQLEVGLGPITSTTMGNVAAVAAEIDPTKSTCADVSFHENLLGLSYRSAEPTVRDPSKLLVAKIGDSTIAVLISATTKEEYAAWLPIAQAYVGSFEFDNAASR